MFGFGKKPTKLEEFCSTIGFEQIMGAYESQKDEQGLYTAIAMVILYASNNLKTLLLENRDLMKYSKATNPDVLIFEASALIHSSIAYSFSGSDLEVEYDEDGDLAEAIYDSIGLVSAFFQRFTDFPRVNETLASRGYPPSVHKSLERFTRILISSKGLNCPSPKSEFVIGDLSSEIGIRIMASIFAGSMLPATVETVNRIIVYHAGA